MTKQEYLDSLPWVNGNPNLPGVWCDRKYKFAGPIKDLHLCEMTDDGWYCSKCNETYPFRKTCN